MSKATDQMEENEDMQFQIGLREIRLISVEARALKSIDGDEEIALVRNNSLTIVKKTAKTIRVKGIEMVGFSPKSFFDVRIEVEADFGIGGEKTPSLARVKESIEEWGMPVLAYLSLMVGYLTKEMQLPPFVLHPHVEGST